MRGAAAHGCSATDLLTLANRLWRTADRGERPRVGPAAQRPSEAHPSDVGQRPVCALHEGTDAGWRVVVRGFSEVPRVIGEAVGLLEALRTRLRRCSRALPPEHLFTNFQTSLYYWSSTTSVHHSGLVWSWTSTTADEQSRR